MINLYACLLTIVLELIVIVIFFNKFKLGFLMGISILMNIITNLTLNYILQLCNNKIVIYWVLLIILEILIILVEARGYYFLIKDNKKAFKISFFCNLFSFIIGTLILNTLIFLEKI